jgi:hypothetical protein
MLPITSAGMEVWPLPRLGPPLGMSCDENAAEGSTNGKVRYQQRLSQLVFGLVHRHLLQFYVHETS